LASAATRALDGCHGDVRMTTVARGQTCGGLQQGVSGTVLVSRSTSRSGNPCPESTPVRKENLFAIK